MVPKMPMLAIKNLKRNSWSVFTLLMAVFLYGCTPPGPRALLQGEKYIQEGKWEEAILTLQRATQLLPNNAQAWNHLGIAYHANHQPELALKCYKSALWLDRNLAAARYNLGCLLLEQNDVAGAMEQLTSFTFLQPSSADGWIKLGTAQMRNKRVDLAEKSFKTALEHRPNDPEAFNNLGVIQLQRRRTQEAMAYFKSALDKDPSYGPALLNLAVLTHQNPSTRSQALAHYRKYLALEPKPSDWEKVQAVAAQLDLDLNPPPLQLNPVAHAPIRTNALPVAAVAQPPTNRVTQVKPAPITNAPAPIAAPARTQVVAAVTPPVSLAPTNPPRLVQAPVITNTPPAPPTNKPLSPVLVEATRSAPKAPPLEVTRVQENFAIKPPQDLASSSSPKTGTAAPLVEQKPETSAVSNNPGPSPSNLSAKNATQSEPPAPAPASKQGAGAETLPSVENWGSSFPRYTYLSPTKPGSGNRQEAQKFYAEGVRLHKAGALREAFANYQKAIQWDPAYFEACYNLGLAAYERGQLKQSLAAYEYALVLNPDSVDARYNFALALKQAGYPVDAAMELNRVLKARPNDVRAHFSLANLYAYQVKRAALARDHFQKVLELNPRHPQASDIRYWLANNR